MASGDEPSEAPSLTSNQPVPTHRLEEIATNVSTQRVILMRLLTGIEICDSIFQSVTEYEHSKTESWNSSVIVNPPSPL